MTQLTGPSGGGAASAPAPGNRQPFGSVEQVTKVYRTVDGFLHAVDEVSFDIGEHEFVSIVGPSGCGKSTLLMMISGLVPYSAGTIHIHGRPVLKPYTDLGIVFQRDV